jgi:hypothetical protein
VKETRSRFSFSARFITKPPYGQRMGQRSVKSSIKNWDRSTRVKGLVSAFPYHLAKPERFLGEGGKRGKTL